jgi:hypothetical protein
VHKAVDIVEPGTKTSANLKSPAEEGVERMTTDNGQQRHLPVLFGYLSAASEVLPVRLDLLENEA